MNRNRNAFTLVELLVVIGILAVLISMLLPALNRARAAANQVTCSAKLRSLGQAEILHATEHQGYMAISGDLYIGATNLPATPSNLNDSGMRRYDYYADAAGLRPMPLAAALCKYLGSRSVRADSLANMTADINAGILRNAFTCPTDVNSQLSLGKGLQIYGGSTGYFQVIGWNSYCQNAEVLGWGDAYSTPAGHSGNTDHDRARGLLSAVRRPSETMLMCDGLPWGGIVVGGGDFDIYGHVVTATLGDAYLQNANAGRTKNFDSTRHRNMANILFVDGHVESFVISAKDLAHVYLASGLR